MTCAQAIGTTTTEWKMVIAIFALKDSFMTIPTTTDGISTEISITTLTKIMVRG